VACCQLLRVAKTISSGHVPVTIVAEAAVYCSRRYATVCIVS
jgi:hypothetical protein